MEIDDNPLGAFRVLVYFSFALPWTVVQFYDGISEKKATMKIVWIRLLLTTFLSTLGCAPAICYIYYSSKRNDYTEVATVSISLLINFWFWARNAKGYHERYKLRILRNAYVRLVSRATDLKLCNIPLSDDTGRFFSGPRWAEEIWQTVKINNTIIDNDLRNTVGPLPSGHRWIDKPETSRALWSLAWSQAEYGKLKPKVSFSGLDEGEAYIPGNLMPSISEPYYLDYNRKTWKHNEALLKSENLTHNQFLEQNLVEIAYEYNEWVDKYNKTVSRKDRKLSSMLVKDSREERINGLRSYPNGEGAGQQDVVSFSTSDYIYSLDGVTDNHTDGHKATELAGSHTGFLTLLKYVSHRVPERLTGAWYSTEAWADVVEELQGVGPREPSELWLPKMLSQEQWRDVAMNTAKTVIGGRPGNDELTRYIGRIVATSALITLHQKEYTELVRKVHHIGIQARLTYGWSGRLACYSGLWTETHVYLALLDGLTLLVIRRNLAEREEVQELLSAIAAFNIMSERGDSTLKEAQHRELQKRYEQNKSKTCRGSGLHALRRTCQEIGIPGAASELDGLPALIMGWATEYRLGQPGNQRPEHGENHDDVELKYGSSNAFRYPYNLM